MDVASNPPTPVKRARPKRTAQQVSHYKKTLREKAAESFLSNIKLDRNEAASGSPSFTAFGSPTRFADILNQTNVAANLTNIVAVQSPLKPANSFVATQLKDEADKAIPNTDTSAHTSAQLHATASALGQLESSSTAATATGASISGPSNLQLMLAQASGNIATRQPQVTTMVSGMEFNKMMKQSSINVFSHNNSNNDQLSIANTQQQPISFTNSKIIFTTQKGSPMSLFTILTAQRRPKRRKSVSTMNAFIPLATSSSFQQPYQFIQQQFRKPESYAHYLAPSGTLNAQSAENTQYNPNYLDDPELKTGKHRTVITLPCFMGSILHPTDPNTLKEELNELFKASHPMVDASLTLSQIRKIKRVLTSIATECEIELSSAAMAIVYFEKLVLKGIVNKENRKVVAGTCIFLACKVNDPKETDYKGVLQIISSHLSVSPKSILEYEFEVYSNLEFSLYVPLWELMPHLSRIFGFAGVSGVEEYSARNWWNSNVDR